MASIEREKAVDSSYMDHILGERLQIDESTSRKIRISAVVLFMITFLTLNLHFMPTFVDRETSIERFMGYFGIQKSLNSRPPLAFSRPRQIESCDETCVHAQCFNSEENSRSEQNFKACVEECNCIYLGQDMVKENPSGGFFPSALNFAVTVCFISVVVYLAFRHLGSKASALLPYESLTSEDAKIEADTEPIRARLLSSHD